MNSDYLVWCRKIDKCEVPKFVQHFQKLKCISPNKDEFCSVVLKMTETFITLES
ncbi:unnamed protein product [Larinioides sclopetarius]|uniref:Uncharacterized protein n=1 Tax=Larinioides sclopetarius TaxID=280406 RepID=A0AAV2BVR8_9ARAC